MTRVKICGIKRREDALFAAMAGADAIGFIFYKGSKRYIEPEEAQIIAEALPPFVSKIGVFVDEEAETVAKIGEIVGLTHYQLHGAEPPEYCRDFPKERVIKAFRVRDFSALSQMEKYREVCCAFLLDAYKKGVPGGTGEVFDWEIAKAAKGLGLPIILSGGLRVENVAEAVREVKPYGVDVSSGVEILPGVKDREKMREFIRLAKLGGFDDEEQSAR